MSYYNEHNCGYRDSICGNGWGVGLSAIVGGALGYWAGRSGAPANAPSPCVVGDGGCRTCYQQGVEAGQTMAGLDYIGKQVASNSTQIQNSFLALNNQLNNQTAAIQARFDALNQQKIADQAAQIAALRTQNIIGMNAAATNAQLTSINDKISSIVTNCGVRAYPGCPPTCGSCVNQ